MSSSSAYPRRTGCTSVGNATGRRVFDDLEVTSQSSQKGKKHLSVRLDLCLSGVSKALELF